jgi:hypothetical protein
LNCTLNVCLVAIVTPRWDCPIFEVSDKSGLVQSDPSFAFFIYGRDDRIESIQLKGCIAPFGASRCALVANCFAIGEPLVRSAAPL